MDKARIKPPLSRCISRDAPEYPAILLSRLGKDAPAELTLLGNPKILLERRTALFCSARTPGDAILRAHDGAARMRDQDIAVISGFHSPIENECLRILLRGKQPIIVCPARAIETMRIPAECRVAFDGGRVLFLSPFKKQPKRVIAESAVRRNVVVAALADEAYIAYVDPGGQIERISQMLAGWGVATLEAPT